MIGMTQTTQAFDETVQQFCSLLVFQLAGQAFALNIESVAQIIPMLRLTPVPQATDMIEGVANIHGKIVPMISARRHLGMPYQEPGLYTPIILARVGERQMGWIVDEVMDVINVPVENVTPPTDILPDGLEQTQVISGLVYQQDQTIVVLDPRCFIRPSQFRMINRAVHTNLPSAPVQPPLDSNDSDDFQPPSIEKVNAVLNENGSKRTSGNGKAKSAAKADRADQPKPPAALELPAAAVQEAPAAQQTSPAPSEPDMRSEPSTPIAVENPVTRVPDPAASLSPVAQDQLQSQEQSAPEEKPAAENQPAAKPARSSKRGNRKGKIIPHTGSRKAAQRSISADQKIIAALARQFTALALEVVETEDQSISISIAKTEPTGD